MENATGSEGADTLIGDDGPHRLAGGGGADHIVGRGGDDKLFGTNVNAGRDDGANTIDGGPGNDGPLLRLRLTCASGETCVQTVSLRDGHRRLARRRGVLVTPGHPPTVLLRLSRAPRHGRLLVVVDFTDTFHGSFSPYTFFGGLVRLR